MDFPLIELGGNGPTLNVAPANGFPPETYLPMVSPMMKTHHVVSLPPRALWGQESPPVAPGNWEIDVAADLLNGLKSHSMRDVIALGHSFGGIASMLAVLNEPARFRALIMLDPTILSQDILRGLDAAKSDGSIEDFPLAVRALKRQRNFASRDAAFTYFRTRGIFADWAEPALQAYVEHGLTPGKAGYELTWSPEWEAYYFKSGYTDTWRKLPQLDGLLPILIVRGGKSDTYVAASAQLVQDLLPSAKHIELPGHGHLFPQSAPVETGQIVSDWLASH